MALSDRILNFNLSRNLNESLVSEQNIPLGRFYFAQGDKERIRLRFYEENEGTLTPLNIDEDEIQLAARWDLTNAQLFTPADIDWEVYSIGINEDTSLYGGLTYETGIGSGFTVDTAYPITQNDVDLGATFKVLEVDASGGIKKGIILQGGVGYTSDATLSIENPLGNPQVSQGQTLTNSFSSGNNFNVTNTESALFELDIDIPSTPQGVLFNIGDGKESTASDVSIESAYSHLKTPSVISSADPFSFSGGSVTGWTATDTSLVTQNANLLRLTNDSSNASESGIYQTVSIPAGTYNLIFEDMYAAIDSGEDGPTIYVELSNDGGTTWLGAASIDIGPSTNLLNARSTSITINQGTNWNTLKIRYDIGGATPGTDDYVEFSAIKLIRTGVAQPFNSEINFVPNSGFEEIAVETTLSAHTNKSGTTYEFTAGSFDGFKYLPNGTTISFLQNDSTGSNNYSQGDSATIVESNDTDSSVSFYKVYNTNSGSTFEITSSEAQGTAWDTTTNVTEKYAYIMAKVKSKDIASAGYADAKIGLYSQDFSVIYKVKTDLNDVRVWPVEKNLMTDQEDVGAPQAFVERDYLQILFKVDISQSKLGRTFKLVFGPSDTSTTTEHHDIKVGFTNYATAKKISLSPTNSYINSGDNSNATYELYPLHFQLSSMSNFSEGALTDTGRIQANSGNILFYFSDYEDNRFFYDDIMYELTIDETSNHTNSVSITLPHTVTWEDNSANTTYTLSGKNSVRFIKNGSSGLASDVMLSYSSSFAINKISLKPIAYNQAGYTKFLEDSEDLRNIKAAAGSVNNEYFMYQPSVSLSQLTEGVLLSPDPSILSLNKGSRYTISFKDIDVFHNFNGSVTTNADLIGFTKKYGWEKIKKITDSNGFSQDSLELQKSSSLDFGFEVDSNYEQFAIAISGNANVIFSAIELSKQSNEVFAEFFDDNLIFQVGGATTSQTARIEIPTTNYNLQNQAVLSFLIDLENSKIELYANNNLLDTKNINQSFPSNQWSSTNVGRLLHNNTNSNSSSGSIYNGQVNGNLDYYENPSALDLSDNDIRDIVISTLPAEAPNYSVTVDLDTNEVHSLFNLGLTEAEATFDVQVRNSDNSRVRTLCQFTAEILRDINFNGSSGTPYTP